MMQNVVSPVAIGMSVFYALLLAAILSILWPFLPANLAEQMHSAAMFALGAMVIGAGKVALDLINDV